MMNLLNLDNLVNELNEMATGLNIHCCAKVVSKNGYEKLGIEVDFGDIIRPLIYVKEGDSKEVIFARIMAAMTSKPDIDFEEVFSPQYVAENIYLGIGRPSEEDFLKKEYLNVEIFMRLRVQEDMAGNVASIKINDELKRRIGFSETTLWHLATLNTFQLDYSIKCLGEVLGIPEEYWGETPLKVVLPKRTSFRDGAIALYNEALFKEYCYDHNAERLYLIPSSTQELLLIEEEDLDGIDPTMLLNINSECNEEVEEDIRLNPTIYMYDFSKNEISIVVEK